MTLQNEEKRLFPQFADTLRYNWFPCSEIERRREEHCLADAIICASSFTKRTLIEVGVPPQKVHVDPYGVDQGVFTASSEKYARFTVIWAGSYTQSKGIAYLLEALARKPVPDAQLLLAGYPYGADPVLTYEDRISVRRMGHVSREELGQVMGRCHAHVFPTLADGFGRNIIEAMSAGLPVVTTPNCAGPDLIEDGVTGFIVPVRDTVAICETLAWIHTHPDAAVEIGERARHRVAGLTPEDYRRRFSDRIHSIWTTLCRLRGGAS